MVTQKQFIEHYEKLYAGGAIYVWGANAELITKALMTKLFKRFGSKTYTKAYYDNKLKEGLGKLGADCSGSIYPLSKNDKTAKGYYQSCEKTGPIKDLPKDIACLVFNKDFTHVGAYLGNNTTIEMMSSQRNCVKQTFNPSRWAYYGIPSWLDTTVEPSKKENAKKAVIKNIQIWCNAYANTKLKTDGIYGPKTEKGLCKALQHCLNVKFNAKIQEDGVFGPKTKAKCEDAPRAKELIYICQAMLYCKGYDMSHSIRNNNLDASYGMGTKKTVYEYQQDTKGLRHDGICGPATFYAMFNS